MNAANVKKQKYVMSPNSSV